MLDINLIPLASRKKVKKSILPEGFQIPLEVIIGLGAGLFGLIMLMNIVLLYLRFEKVRQYRELKKEWQSILPDKEKVDSVLNDMRQLQAEFKSIESIAPRNRVLWSQKLNIISDQLPHGVWFKRVVFNKDNVFMIEGSTIIKDSAELINVHRFASNLKRDPHFLEGLVNLELGSIQRRTIGHVDIADFLLTAKIK